MTKRKRIKQTQDLPAQPDAEEQSGSTGRHTDKDDLGHEKDTGQDRYGQSGFSGAEPVKNRH